MDYKRKLGSGRQGITTLLVVFIVTMIVTFIVVVWQSRLLLVIQRGQALADVLKATYNAETEVNDVLARFLGGLPIPAPGEKMLADGTRLLTEVTITDVAESLTIRAARQFATSRLVVSREKTGGVEAAYDEVEIVLALDCTGSMNGKANEDCTGPNCPTRVTMARQATLTFLDSVLALPPAERNKFRVGVETFRVTAKWVAEPTADIWGVRQAVEAGLTDNVNGSPACELPPAMFGGSGETSLGTAAVWAADYLTGSQAERKKQVMVLVTDGLPNASVADARCGTENCRSNDGGVCTEGAIEYATCGVADVNTQWKSGTYGLRQPEVDVYGVTVMSYPSSPNERLAYDATVNLLSNTSYVKKYYNSENAERLPEFLEDIFGEINKTIYELRIRRVVPTLPL